MGRDEKISTFRLETCMKARSMKTIAVARPGVPRLSSLSHRLVSHFQYIDPVLQEAVQAFILRKNLLTSF
jgi:hypothetical protein